MGTYFTQEDLLDLENNLTKASNKDWILGAMYCYFIIFFSCYYFFH